MRVGGLIVAALALIGPSACSSDGGPPAPCPITEIGPGSSYRYAIQVAVLGRIDGTMPGEVAGLNIDDQVDDGSGLGCVERHEDYTSPDGTPGIDNQIANLLELAGAIAPIRADVDGDMISGEAIDDDVTGDGISDERDLLQPAINRRSFVFLIELTGVESTENDDCVGVRMDLAEPAAVPSDPYTTFPPDTAFTSWTAFPDVVTTARIEDGRLFVAPSSFLLAFMVGTTAFELAIDGMEIEADVSPTALANGVLGGALRTTDIVDLIDATYPGLGGIATTSSDIDAEDDGSCEGMSVGLTFDAVRATF